MLTIVYLMKAARLSLIMAAAVAAPYLQVIEGPSSQTLDLLLFVKQDIYRPLAFWSTKWGHHTPSRGDSHMKGAGMLVVSLRGVNFGFWSHLACSRQNAIIFSREGLV